MESQHLQHNNTFRKILYENDQASSLGARNTQEECPSSQLPTPVTSGKKVQDFIKAKEEKSCSCSFFYLCNNIRFARAVSQTLDCRLSGRGRLNWDVAGGERVCRFAFGLEMVLKTRLRPGGRR